MSRKNKTEQQLWDIFSKFIRVRDTDENGYCRCISCSKVSSWKSFDAGHYISRGSDRALKYNEMNVNAQCTACNKFKSGNLINYRQGLIRKYGEKEVKKLEEAHYMKTSYKKLNQLQINASYDYYKLQLEALKANKNI